MKSKLLSIALPVTIAAMVLAALIVLFMWSH
jgi:hypothetical protein